MTVIELKTLLERLEDEGFGGSEVVVMNLNIQEHEAVETVTPISANGHSSVEIRS